MPVTLDMPGKVADFLPSAELKPAERAALDHGVTVRRGQGYTLRVSTTPAIHRQLLARCQPLDGGQGARTVPAQRQPRATSSRHTARPAIPVPPTTRALRLSVVAVFIPLLVLSGFSADPVGAAAHDGSPATHQGLPPLRWLGGKANDTTRGSAMLRAAPGAH
jgi:hypothetical protein